MTRTVSTIAARLTAARDAAESDLCVLIRVSAPDEPLAQCGLLDWILNAASADRRRLAAITRSAWAETIGPATLTGRFHAAGLHAPLGYVLAARRGLLGHLLSGGLTVYQAAEVFVADPGYLYRLVGRGGERRTTLGLMRAEPPLWAARHFLLPLLRDVPPTAWTLERLLHTRTTEKEP